MFTVKSHLKLYCAQYFSILGLLKIVRNIENVSDPKVQNLT